MCQPCAIKQGCDRLCDLELLVGASGRGLIDCDVPNNPVRRRHGNWRSPSVAPECLSVLAPGAGLRRIRRDERSPHGVGQVRQAESTSRASPRHCRTRAALSCRHISRRSRRLWGESPQHLGSA